MKKVTVLLINKNHGHYLDGCLESIKNQSFNSVQTIVIDGNSSDDSHSISGKYDDVEFISEQDLGSNHAFAKGLNLVETDYLTFLTSTDRLRDITWLDKSVEALENSPRISMVVGGIAGILPGGEDTGYRWPLTPIKQREDRAVFLDYLFHGNGMTPISIVVRTEVAKRCLEPLDQFTQKDETLITDFFYLFQRNFFQSGYIAWYIGDAMVDCVLHTDRHAANQKVVSRHLKWLNDEIKLFRRQLLSGLRHKQLLDPSGHQLPHTRISYHELLHSFLAKKILFFFYRRRLQARDRMANQIYRGPI